MNSGHAHEPMTRLKGVEDIVEFETDMSRLVGFHRDSLVKAFAKSATQNAGTDQFLTSARKALCPVREALSIAGESWKLIDDFHNPIGITLGT